MKGNKDKTKKDTKKGPEKKPVQKAPEKKPPEKKVPEKKHVEPEKKHAETEKKHTEAPKKPAIKTSTAASNTTKKPEAKVTIKKEPSTVSTSSTRPATARSNVETKKSVGKAPTVKASTSARAKSRPKNPEDAKNKFPKFMKLIERRKLFSGIHVVLKKRFIHWKQLTVMQKQMVREKTSKTVVTKKRLNIHRLQKPVPQQQSGIQRAFTTMEPEMKAEELSLNTEEKEPTPTNVSEEEKKARIKAFIESRINSYESKENLMKRFFYRWWKGKKMLTTKTLTKSNLVKKKKIFLIKERSKNIFAEGALGAKNESKEEFNRKMSLANRPSVSFAGNKLLSDKIIKFAEANKSSKNLTKIEFGTKSKASKHRASKSSKLLPKLQDDENKDKDKEKEKEAESAKSLDVKKEKKVFRLRPEKNKERILFILNKCIKLKNPVTKKFNLWKSIHIGEPTATEKHKIIKKSKIKLVREKGGKEPETQPEDTSVQTTEETVVEPKEDEIKLKSNKAEVKDSGKKEMDPKKKLRVRNLVLNISRNRLNIYFNRWKANMGTEQLEILKRSATKTVINKKVINLQKRKKEGKDQPTEAQEVEFKELTLEIPQCPVSSTPNYLKNINNLSLIQYFPNEIYCFPSREVLLKSNIFINLEGEKGKRKPIVERRRNIRSIFVKYLILYYSKGLLIKYFNRWKYRKLPIQEIEEIIKKGKRKMIGKKRIEITKIPKEGLTPQIEEEDEIIKKKGKTIKHKKPGEPDDENKEPAFSRYEYLIDNKPKNITEEDKKNIYLTYFLSYSKLSF